MEQQNRRNLARVWRSATFEDLIGQDMAVRMLKNSLYLGHLFPVYLFSGQRGCGKTSMARIFATAVNCQQRAQFVQDPKKNMLPCRACVSCLAMIAGKHPDFIEIDAASHTGVDHVRQIIEASSLMPLLGQYKIYLIDEAHMLSKAAFNAFLKILEEPPASVLFMLATTDPEKILETVLSRCFRLFIKAVEPATLADHIEHICKIEKIAYEREALLLIARVSDGSVRDALNMLEQVRFAYDVVTYDATLTALGHINDEQLIKIVDALAQQDIQKLAQHMKQSDIQSYSPYHVWQSLILILRGMIFINIGIADKESVHQEAIALCAKQFKNIRLMAMLQWLYDHEAIMLKTASAYQYIEVTLFELHRIAHDQEQVVVATAPPGVSEKIVAVAAPTAATSVGSTQWASFMQQISNATPMVASVLKQGKIIQENTDNIMLCLQQSLSMFQDVIVQAARVWQPLLDAAYGRNMVLNIEFEKTSMSRPVDQQRNVSSQPKIDVSDKTIWRTTNAVLEAFDGTVAQILDKEQA